MHLWGGGEAHVCRLSISPCPHARLCPSVAHRQQFWAAIHNAPAPAPVPAPSPTRGEGAQPPSPLYPLTSLQPQDVCVVDFEFETDVNRPTKDEVRTARDDPSDDATRRDLLGTPKLPEI